MGADGRPAGDCPCPPRTRQVRAWHDDSPGRQPVGARLGRAHVLPGGKLQSAFITCLMSQTDAKNRVLQVRTSPAFTSMVFAWSIAEMVRYSTYALALFNIKLYPLEWLRYTLFYVLYPLGAGSEAYLIYRSVPYAKFKYGKPAMFWMMIILALWPPALAIMMGHMHSQRRKHIGGKGPKLPKKRA